MNIKILLFAYLKDRLGTSQLELILPAGSSAKQLLERLESDYPLHKETLIASRLAINQTYILNLDSPISPEDEIALIPPVSGG